MKRINLRVPDNVYEHIERNAEAQGFMIQQETLALVISQLPYEDSYLIKKGLIHPETEEGDRADLLQKIAIKDKHIKDLEKIVLELTNQIKGVIDTPWITKEDEQGV